MSGLLLQSNSMSGLSQMSQLQGLSAMQPPQQQQAPDPQQSSKDSYFLQKQLEVMIDMHNKKTAAEIESMKTTISMLQEEVSALRRMMHDAPRQAAPSQGHGSHSAPSHHESSGQSLRPFVEERPRTDVTKPIDRNGVAPADVAIDKFFNFGSGRKR